MFYRRLNRIVKYYLYDCRALKRQTVKNEIRESSVLRLGVYVLAGHCPSAAGRVLFTDGCADDLSPCSWMDLQRVSSHVNGDRDRTHPHDSASGFTLL